MAVRGTAVGTAAVRKDPAVCCVWRPALQRAPDEQGVVVAALEVAIHC